MIERFLRPLRRRIHGMVGRAVLRAVNEAAKLQEVQIEARRGELLDGVERFQEYGFSSVPEPGAEAVLLAMGGMRQHSLAIAVDDRRHRPTDLAEGEVCLYTRLDEAGNLHRVILTEDRNIRAQAGDAFIEISPKQCVISAGVIELRGATKTVRIP